MKQKSLDFFEKLLNTPSPSGFEEKAAALYREYTSKFADEVYTDVMGNTIAVVNPKAKRKIMLAGHIDEIGFLVRYVSDDGFIYFAPIGGHDTFIVPGQRVYIHTSNNERIPGVIGRKAIHLMEEEERRKKPEIHDLWIDIGASKKDEVMEKISIGDPITYQWEFQKLMGDVATARGFDNRMGSFICAEALRLFAESKSKDVGVYAVATVQEEIGLRGAKTASYGISADAGIAVDVGFATDYPTIDKKRIGDFSIGKGPVVTRGANINPVLYKLVLETAKEEKIAIQLEAAASGTGTDANAMQLNQAGMATGLVHVPIRYMHTPCELLNMNDVENSAKLIAGFCKRVTKDTDFTPRA